MIFEQYKRRIWHKNCYMVCRVAISKMDCCLVKVSLLLICCGLIFACPENHHEHNYQPAQTNAIEDTNLLKDEDIALENEPLQNIDIKIEGIDEEDIGGIVIVINDEIVSEAAQTEAPLNSSVVIEDHTHSENTTYIECVCALFSLRFPIETDAPLMSKTFYNVSCDGHASGRDVCSELCVGFAVSQYEEKFKIICSYLYNITGLTGYLHSKHCEEEGAWTFTGLQTEKPLCCKNGMPSECEEKTSTVTIEY